MRREEKIVVETLTENLMEILLDEKVVYEQMLLISEEMTDAIVAGDPDPLSKMIEEETALAEKAAELDRERVSISETLAERLGLGAAPALSELCEQIKNPQQRAELLQLRSGLVELVHQLTALNGKNQELLSQKKDYFAAMMDTLLSTEQVGTYDSRGGSEVLSGSAGLFDRQV